MSRHATAPPRSPGRLGASRAVLRHGAAACLAIALLGAATVAAAQGTTRRLTTIEALHQFSGYFHLQQVLLRGEFVESGTEIVLRADQEEIRLLNPSEATKGPVEVRGELIDVGRLTAEDPRLRDYAQRRGDRPWPARGAELLLNIGSVLEAQPATMPSIRALALEPWKFDGQTVTVTGNFRGRNLFGDLPEAPGTSRYDFVLTAAEGAVWVTGLRPQGRGFDLDVDRRLDTDRWLRVTGTVARQRGLVTIAAKALVAAEPEASEDAAPQTTQVAPPPRQPTTVVFSAPTPDEIDVPPGAPVRIQFSRGLDEELLEGRIRVTYEGATPTDPAIEFKATYDGATRAIQIDFAKPLEEFRTVKVELLDGLTAFDGAPAPPWTLTFSVGAAQ